MGERVPPEDAAVALGGRRELRGREAARDLTDETIAEQIVDFISANRGTGWTHVEEATPGVGVVRRRAVRDGLLKAGRIVNVVKIEGVETLSPRFRDDARPVSTRPTIRPSNICVRNGTQTGRRLRRLGGRRL